MTEEQIQQVEDWTDSELFNALIGLHIIAPDEVFEDWMHDRPLMIDMVRQDMIETDGIDVEENQEL